MRTYWAVLLAALGFVPLACAGPPADAATLVSSWAAATNAHDLTAAESLFSPDAVIDDGSGAAGADRIHNWNAMVVDRYQIRVERVTPISSTQASALVAISSVEASRPMPAAHLPSRRRVGPRQDPVLCLAPAGPGRLDRRVHPTADAGAGGEHHGPPGGDAAPGCRERRRPARCRRAGPRCRHAAPKTARRAEGGAAPGLASVRRRAKCARIGRNVTPDIGHRYQSPA